MSGPPVNEIVNEVVNTEEYAFDAERWSHRVEVSVSPTGRSVQVFVDGKKVL